MKLEINTTNKTVAILEKVTMKELSEFLEKNGWADWTILPEIKIEWFPNTPSIVPVKDLYTPPYPNTPYTTTNT